MIAVARKTEDVIASLALGGIMVLPLAEIASRNLRGQSLPGSGPFASNLMAWVALFGAAVAAREGKLLTLATGEFLPKGWLGAIAHVIAGFVAAAVTTLFVLGSVRLLQNDKEVGEIIAAHVPLWVADLALPIGFTLI